jgi:prolipoprotein diacylglyceryl transferase
VIALAGGLLASIPSPSDGALKIGPLKIHAYGLMIALGVVAAVWLFGRRLEEKKIGTRDDANAIALWAVIAGVIGSRLYHVATDWSKFSHHLSNIPKIWQGGLGIPGGLLGGITVGAYMIRRRGLPVGLALNCAAPALPLAQALGRWGNYFNQELYGGPTKLPWGLEIDTAHAPVLADGSLKYMPGTLFQPTFLYESLLNLALVGVLLLIDRRYKVRPGHLIAMYLLGYGVIRFFVEGMRIDEAHHVGGLRWNQWVALGAVIVSALYLIVTKDKPAPEPALIEGTPDGGEAAEADAASADAEAASEGADAGSVGADAGEVEGEPTPSDVSVPAGDEPGGDDDPPSFT